MKRRNSMKRYAKIMVCMAMMVSLLVPTRANAASLDDVPRKIAGYSVVTEDSVKFFSQI